MKIATSLTAALYGSTWADMEIGGKTYPVPKSMKPVSKSISLDVTSWITQDFEVRGRTKLLWVHKSANKGKFDDGKIYFAVHAKHRMVWRPFVEKEVSTYLDVEEAVDELNVASAWVVPEASETGAGRDSVGVLSTSLQGPDSRSFRASRVANRREQKVRTTAESSREKERM